MKIFSCYTWELKSDGAHPIFFDYVIMWVSIYFWHGSFRIKICKANYCKVVMQKFESKLLQGCYRTSENNLTSGSFSFDHVYSQLSW